jgi:hypothetical protein
MKEIIGIIAAALVFVAYAPYFRDILKNKTKPHVYSWFIWGLTSMMIFALQISHGGGAGSYTTGTVAVVSFVVCLLALKHGTKYITKSDTVFFIMALVAAVVWLFAERPTLSMILLIITDMLGVIPSMRKAWHKPNEETLSMWSLNGFRHALSILALTQYSLLTLLNPVTWAVTNFGFSLMLVKRRRVAAKE